MRPPHRNYDVVIVGGGPAGLSAGLVLGRCGRNVLLCDGGRPRNASSRAVHGFLTRDGVSPQEFRRVAREQLAAYDSVKAVDLVVSDAEREAEAFCVWLSDGSQVRARKLLLATGLIDQLPPIAGLPELWGKGVFPCPYCDAWEVRGQRLAAYGRGSAGLALCRALCGWTRDLYLFSDGPAELEPVERRALAAHGIELREQRVLALEQRDGCLWRVVLENAEPVECDALFVEAPQQQQSPLAQKLGCPINPRGLIDTREWESTEVPGLYVAGDASRDVQLAIVAAAEGARAAFDINRALAREVFDSGR